MSETNIENRPPIRSKLIYYIEGELLTIRQDFPTTRQELAANLADAGVGAEHAAELLDSIHETAVYALDYNLPRKPDLDELNELAHRLAGMSGEELATFGCVLEAGGPWNSITEIINVTHNLDQFDFYPGKFAPRDFGGIMLETHASEHWEVVERLRASTDMAERDFIAYVERLERSVDLEKYAPLAQKADGGALTRSGYLVPLAGSLPEKYSGPEDIPAEHLLTTRLETPERKPSLLGAVAALREKRAADAPEPERNAHTGPEL